MEREIFAFTGADGQPKRADPWEVERRLRTLLGKDPRVVVQVMRGEDIGLALQAAERLSWAVCTAFRLGEPWDQQAQQGEVVERVWMNALSAWLGWMEKNVLGVSSWPTSSKPTPDSESATPATSSASSGTTALA